MSASAEHAFAVVESVEADGLRLKFDGEETAGEKTYKCNTFFKFAAGDRVYCVKDSGTFVAICKIGVPATQIVADYVENAVNVEYAETAGTAKSAKTAENADEAKIAAAVDMTDRQDWESVNRVVFGKGDGSNGIMYANDIGYEKEWYLMGAVRDYAHNGANIIFRSNGNGRIQVCTDYFGGNWYDVN